MLSLLCTEVTAEQAPFVCQHYPEPAGTEEMAKIQVSQHCLYVRKEISLLLQLPWEYVGEDSSSAEDAVSALYKYL